MTNHTNTEQRSFPITPAQRKLLEMVDHLNASDFAEALKEVHELGTYFVHKDLVNLSSSRQVHWLYDSIAAIAMEKQTRQTA